MKRRSFVQSVTVGAGVLGLSGVSGGTLAGSSRINHSVCRWTFGHLSIEELCKAAADLGITGIDLVGEADWPLLQKYHLASTMCNGAEPNITDGFCDPRFHNILQKNYSTMISKVAAAGHKNLICFSGNRRGIDEKTGMDHCEKALTPLIIQAEREGVILQMELFNSRVDHPDYMADKSAWGVALCKRFESPSFKLLYDIYHMQIDEGDIIRSIQQNHNYFGHYHVAGNPGRHEPFGNQEINYPAVMLAIADTGFRGYVAQEFINTGSTNAEKLENLKKAVRTCTV